MRAVCDEAEELPLEQTTSAGRNEARPPSSPHAGDNVRAQNARPIPRSAAHKIVAMSGQATRLPCDDGCSLAAATVETWFELGTDQDPGWRMMRSRPAIADRDGPALVGPAHD